MEITTKKNHAFTSVINLTIQVGAKWQHQKTFNCDVFLSEYNENKNPFIKFGIYDIPREKFAKDVAEIFDKVTKRDMCVLGIKLLCVKQF